MAKKDKNELKINPIFEPLFEDCLDQPRYTLLYGGRGSGKSFTAAIAIVQKTYSKYKHKILYLRNSMSSSEDSTIADIRTAIEKLGVERDFREKAGLITNIRTGSTITFKGIRSSGTQTAKLKSLSGITTLVIEEAEEVESKSEFGKVDESIRIKGKPLTVMLIFNPTSSIKSWIHKEWFLAGQPNPERFDDTRFLHSTYLNNIENLNPSTVESYERYKTTDPIYYRNTILAEWTLGVSDRIYGGWGHYPEFEEDNCDTWYGLDFGYMGKDKTACVKIKFFEGVYYIEEMFSIAKLSIKETRREMVKAGIPFTAHIYADSAMPLLIYELRELGFTNIRKARKGNVDEGIKKLQNKMVVVVGDDKSDLYLSYMTFSREQNGKIPHEPDILAAVRYGINSRTPIDHSKRIAPRRIMRTKGFI